MKYVLYHAITQPCFLLHYKSLIYSKSTLTVFGKIHHTTIEENNTKGLTDKLWEPFFFRERATRVASKLWEPLRNEKIQHLRYLLPS